jgi:transcriptional regulator with XRE-family HTH domain
MRIVVDAGMSQADLARQLGLAPSTVANDLRLLETAPEVQSAVKDGAITLAHAKVIAGLDVDLQAEFTKRVIGSNWSSHATEQQVKYFASEAKRIREQRATNERHVAEAVELLGKVVNEKRSTIGVSESYGSDVKERLKAAGWKVVDGYDVEVVEQAGACGCAGVWRLSIPYYGDAKVELKPGCNDKAHKDARRAAQDAEYVQRNKASAQLRAAEKEGAKAKATRLGEYLSGEFGDVVQEPLAVRLTIYALIGDVDLDDSALRTYWDGEDEALYDLDDPAWTLLEKVPDADLAKVLGATVAEILMGGWNGPDAVIAAAVEPIVAEPIAKEAPEPLFGQLVIDRESGDRYRIWAGADRIELVADSRQWRNSKVVAIVSPDVLEWDAADKAWRGPTLPLKPVEATA